MLKSLRILTTHLSDEFWRILICPIRQLRPFPTTSTLKGAPQCTPAFIPDEFLKNEEHVEIRFSTLSPHQTKKACDMNSQAFDLIG